MKNIADPGIVLGHGPDATWLALPKHFQTFLCFLILLSVLPFPDLRRSVEKEMGWRERDGSLFFK